MGEDLISRHAAIDVAKNLIVQMDEYHQYNQAINNYCAELVQLPSVQPERNFLSGLTAEEQYDRIKWLFDYGKGFTDSRLAVIEWLEKHSAQPERKKGKWIPHPTERERDVCTACGIGVKRREYGTNPDGNEWVIEESFAFCPWCGADMRGDQ